MGGRAWWGVLVWGCTPDAAGPQGADPTETTGTSVTDDPDDSDPTPTDTATTATDTDTATPWGVDVDCSLLLEPPLTATRYTWVPGSEDFTFDADGYMMQVTGGGLKRTPFGGPSELLVPLSVEVRGSRLLPDGRIALATIGNGGILLVDPQTGGQEVAASGINNPNGLAIDETGKIWIATSNGQILRVDPAGAIDVMVDTPGDSYDGISFSPDYRRLYFNEEFGNIHYVDLDEAGNVGPVETGARIPIGATPFSILDGMAVDACGNLYIAQMSGSVWRVRPDGTVEELIELGGAAIIPALNFGIAPIGGWSETALYVITFTGAVYEIEVGVPGKWEPHLP